MKIPIVLSKLLMKEYKLHKDSFDKRLQNQVGPGNSFIVVEDPRMPTIHTGTDLEAFKLSPGYSWNEMEPKEE